MRRNSCTVIVLASPVPPEVLGAVSRSMNVALVRPSEPAGSSAPPGSGGADRAHRLATAAEALRRAARATSPYALVTADPLAAVAEAWRGMWDLARLAPPGPAWSGLVPIRLRFLRGGIPRRCPREEP